LSDEKTLFNRDNNSKNEEKQLHSIEAEEDSELVDFSSAFDVEDDTVLESDEEYDKPDSEPSTSKFLSLFKRKRNKNKEEKEEIVEQVEKIHDNSDADEEKESVAEEKGKKHKGFSLFGKKEKAPEIPAEETTEENTQEEASVEETEESVEEVLVEESVAETVEEEAADEVAVSEESVDVEETEESVDEVVLVEEPQEETEEVTEEAVEENTEAPAETTSETEENENNEPEKTQFKGKRASGFDFLRRRLKNAPVQEEIAEEPEQEEEIVEAEENEAEESGIEMLPSFEESEQTEEKEESVEATEDDENSTEEATQEDSAYASSEEATEETTEETTEEATEEIELIPPFEEEVEEKVDEESAEQPETSEGEAETENVEESADEQDEKPSVQLLTTRDHVTFILIILALLLTIVFVVVKFIPLNNNSTQDAGEVVQAKDTVSEIQLQREKAKGHFIQSDMDNVFYVYSPDYKPAFYQCNGNKMKAIKTAGKLNPIVEMGNEKISVTVDYIEVDGKLFGTGVFQKTDNLSNIVVFKLVNLPKGYEQDGKALLLATSNSEAVTKRCSIWSDSYIVDLATGETTRFLTSNNSIYSAGYAVLTDEGYASVNGEIPFFSTRDYDATTNKRDIYLKIKGKETRFATDVAGSFVYTDAGVVSYLKVVEEGFNVVRKENGKEKVIFSLDNNTSYLYHNEYLLDKYNGNLYNVKTGEKIVVTGYGMTNPEMMTVSSDGRYLVVVGAVNSVIDYQVHIFDLKTGNCAKYVDENFSQHKNLVFVNDTTIVYSAVEPKQGYEYVMLDVSKAF
jgi:hypothetical protein